MAGRILPILLLASLAAPAAAAGVPLPEGSNLLLFSLGALGVLIGRRASMKRRDRD